ncbi:MAG: PA14 domain-containing protein, partial [Blastocatellia bacterium]
PIGAPGLVRDDGVGFLDFDFGDGGPGGSCGPGVDNFFVRWTRRINFAAGAYRFSVTGNDGVRLYINGQLKIDKWFDQEATIYTTDVVLSASDHDVRLEYYDRTGLAVARLNWTLIPGP